MRMPSWPVLLGTAVLIVVVGVVSVMYRLGAFKEVRIERKIANGPFLLLSREHLGAYHKIAPLITEVEAWARAHSEPCVVTFGEYQDNPENTDEDRLRSRGGCVISSKEKADELSKILPAGTTISTLEIPDALLAEFEGSPAIGPSKVYPRAEQYMQDLELKSTGPVVELYEVTSARSGRTRYLFPVTSAR